MFIFLLKILFMKTKRRKKPRKQETCSFQRKQQKKRGQAKTKQNKKSQVFCPLKQDQFLTFTFTNLRKVYHTRKVKVKMILELDELNLSTKKKKKKNHPQHDLVILSYVLPIFLDNLELFKNELSFLILLRLLISSLIFPPQNLRAIPASNIGNRVKTSHEVPVLLRS